MQRILTPNQMLFTAKARLQLDVSLLLGTRSPLKNSISHIDASLSRQPLVKGERLVRYEVNAVMLKRCTLQDVDIWSQKLLVCLGTLGK